MNTIEVGGWNRNTHMRHDSLTKSNKSIVVFLSQYTKTSSKCCWKCFQDFFRAFKFVNLQIVLLKLMDGKGSFPWMRIFFRMFFFTSFVIQFGCEMKESQTYGASASLALTRFACMFSFVISFQHFFFLLSTPLVLLSQIKKISSSSFFTTQVTRQHRKFVTEFVFIVDGAPTKTTMLALGEKEESGWVYIPKLALENGKTHSHTHMKKNGANIPAEGSTTTADDGKTTTSWWRW